MTAARHVGVDRLDRRARRPSEPPVLFSWHVDGAASGRAACGVTSVQARAVQDASEAMRETGGTDGVIRTCRVSYLGTEYDYGTVAARCEVDGATGAVVWHEARA